MAEARQHRTRSFADCVRACAQDAQVVEACNGIHGTHLRAPITALLNPSQTSEPDSPAAQELVCFIGFVHRNVWQHVLRARRKQAGRAAMRS